MKTVNTHVLFVGRLVWRDLKSRSDNLSVTKRLGRQVIVDLTLGDLEHRTDGRTACYVVPRGQCGR